MITVGTDLGGHLTLARELAAGRIAATRILATAAAFKGWLSLLGLVLLGAVAVRHPDAAGLLLWLVPALLALSWIEWIGYALRGFGRVVAESGLLAAACAAAFAGGAAALAFGAGPAGLAASHLVSLGLAAAAAAAWFARSRHAGSVARPRPAASTGGEVRRSAAAAGPTGAAILMSMLSWKLGLLALPRLWAGAADLTALTGRYAAAHRILEVARFLPAMIAAALYPSFARRDPRVPPRPAALAAAGLGTAVAVAFSIPGAAAAFLALLLGPAYDAAGPVLVILLWALPFLSLNAVLTGWLVARGRVLTNAGLMGLHLAVHAACLAALAGLPTFEPGRGSPDALAAMGLLAAEAALSAGTLWACRSLN